MINFNNIKIETFDSDGKKFEIKTLNGNDASFEFNTVNAGQDLCGFFSMDVPLVIEDITSPLISMTDNICSTVNFKYNTYVPMRRHKKNRINKKLNKKYGVKTIFKNGEMKLKDLRFDTFENESTSITGTVSEIKLSDLPNQTIKNISLFHDSLLCDTVDENGMRGNYFLPNSVECKGE